MPGQAVVGLGLQTEENTELIEDTLEHFDLTWLDNCCAAFWINSGRVLACNNTQLTNLSFSFSEQF